MTKSKHIVSSGLAAGALFGLVMGAMNGMRYGIASGLGSGLAMGAAFGLAIAGFLAWQHKKADGLRGEFQTEGLERDAPASSGASGGWLFLTKQRVVWIPHALSVGAKRIEIPRDDITGAKANGRRLQIQATTGPRAFHVRSTAEWATAIASLPSARVVG